MPGSDAEQQRLWNKLVAAANAESSFNPNDPNVQLLLLSQRVENLGREKEALERALEREREERAGHESEFEERIAAIEKSFQRGAGVLLVLPFLGTALGIIFAYGKVIFAPWTGGK